MCGIAGFELGPDAERTAALLLDRLARRGPDGGWFEPVGQYGLVQTRLAVIDLSDRVQYPLQNESGDLHLLFNGEIYEYERHRQELVSRGHRFSTECDAEVVLHGYEEWGTSVLQRLDGMFALALLHAPSGELLLARDALGVKPLVYTTGSRFAFSSDAISLVAAKLSSGTIDEQALSDYLSFHYLPVPGTGLRDAMQLAPGELLKRSADGAITTKRWRARPFSGPRSGKPVRIGDVQGALDRSVSSQLVADVPVGVFLSAGIDSSLVLDSAVRAGARPSVFTIGFAGHGDYDESRAAARFARRLGLTHIVGELDTGFARAIESVSSAFDQPFGDASAIATLELAKLARGHVTVVLSGTGGDDLFAGYYRHRAHLIYGIVERLPRRLVHLMAQHPGTRGGERRSILTQARSYLARLSSLKSSDPLSRYLELVGSASSTLVQELSNFSWSKRDGTGSARARLGMPSGISGPLLRSLQAFEFRTYLPGDLLTKEDRASMAVGLETRVPLLSTEFLNLAEDTTDRQKIGYLTGKRLLRDLARRRLPGYVVHGRKKGFAVPLADLLNGPWREEAVAWLHETPSSLVNGRLASSLVRDRLIPATDTWALAALIGWERELARASTAELHVRHSSLR